MATESEVSSTPQSKDTRSAYIARHLRRNFLLMVLDSTSFPLGMSFISIVTILPLFVREITDSSLAVGLVPAINSLGILLTPLFVANMTERKSIQKWFLFWIAVVERLPWLFMAIVIPILGLGSPVLLLVLFFIALTVNSVAQGSNMSSYFTLYAKVIPARYRGSMWGIGGAIAGILGLGGTWASRELLARFGFPNAYALSFLFAFIVLTVGIMGFPFVRELPTEKIPPRVSNLTYLRNLPSVLRRDSQFSVFLLSQVLYTFTLMAPAFYTVYAIDRFHASPGDVALFTTTVIAANTVANLVLGFLADRKGYKLLFQVTMVIAVISPLVALFGPSLGWMYLVFALYSFVYTGTSLGGSNMPMEFAPESQISTYSAVRMAAVAPFRTLVPILGGLIVPIGYGHVFVISAVAAGVGLVLLSLKVRDPRHRHQTA